MAKTLSRINVGRRSSGGVFGGLFGNPVHEKEVTEQYRSYIKSIIQSHPTECGWLKERLNKSSTVLYCPGCGVGSPTCHARILEQEIRKWKPKG